MTPEQLDKALERLTKKLRCLQCQVNAIEEAPVEPDINENMMLARLLPGVASDSIEPYTRVGAVLSGTVTKSGNFDKFAVSGGAYNDSYVYFPNMGFTELDAIMKVRFKVENLNKDGSSGYSLIGIGKHQIQIDNDFSQTFPSIFTVDLINKDVYYQITAGGQVADNLIEASTGNLANNGDILELIVKNDVPTSAKIITVNNLTTGAFLSMVWPEASARHIIGIRQGLLRLNLANADFTILECGVYSASTYKPYLHVIGDSFGSGYDIKLYEAIWAKIREEKAWNVSVSASAGSAMAGIHRFQLREVLNLKARYVANISVIHLAQNEFNSLDPDYADYTLRLGELMDAIVGYGGIPVVPRWPNGFYPANNNDEWDTFIDEYILVNWPTTLVVDFRTIGIVYSDSNHPSAASHALMASALIDVID